jgi:hypothetical protein
MSLLNEVLNTTNLDWSDKFWCKPISFREFVVSKEHLHVAPLSEKQFLAILKLTGDDPLKIFTDERVKHIGVYLLGKGSGKDYMIAILLAYLFYILLCMHNVHDYFGFPLDEPLDLLNVAPTAFQAREVFFQKFKSRLMNWKWLLINFKVTIRNKVVRGCTGSKLEIKITDTSVETSNNIRANSLHAEAGNYEGFNVLVAILDETSEFDDKFEEVKDADGEIMNIGKAELIYNTLRTSAESRKLPWLMAIMSFPRRSDDFTIQKYNEAIEDPDGITIAERGCTWEYNPRFFKEKTFTFEQWEVPVSLKKAFENDPTNSRMKFCTVPPIVLNRFFYNDERIQSAIDENIQPLLILKSDIETIMDGKGKPSRFLIQKVMSSSIANRAWAWAIHIDLSIRSDSTVLAIGHGEPCDIKSTFVDLDGKQTLTTINKKIIIDQIIVWEPDMKKKAIVGHMNVDEITDCLVSLTGCRYISWDQYQSQYVLEKAIRQGMDSESHNINVKDYVLLRNYMWAGGLSIPKHPKLIFELERLIWDGRKVDHLPIYSKDVSDAVCGVVRAIAGGLARSQDSMNFTFCEESMFDPSAGQDSMPGMPGLPREAIPGSQQILNPTDFGVF